MEILRVENLVKTYGEGEKNYIQTTSQLTGVSEERIREYLNQSCELEIGETKYNYFSVNTSLLSYKGYALSDKSLQMFFTLAAIIIAIVIVASVFVIRNSFAISITEKTRLYGMLSSVGATSRQIRHNVLFEGFMLALIGIPLGILLGLLAGLGIFMAFSMNLATDFVVPYTAIAISIVFVFAVVWLIMRFSISKVQKQNIIETIRNDNI